MNKLDAFISLANYFEAYGFSLYLVGGATRDYLMFNEINDIDVVSDATPDEIISFCDYKIDSPFKKYGVLKIYFENYRFDVATLRKENNYSDSRHPNEVIYVKDLKVDVKRRDFTINALYLDSKLKVYDYVGGVKDLEDNIIRMIGDPNKRIKEDPLRILRAIRFMIKLNFSLSPDLEKAIRENIHLIDLLNKQKVLEEIKKMNKSKEELKEVFKEFNILYLLDMIN